LQKGGGAKVQIRKIKYNNERCLNEKGMTRTENNFELEPIRDAVEKTSSRQRPHLRKKVQGGTNVIGYKAPEFGDEPRETT